MTPETVHIQGQPGFGLEIITPNTMQTLDDILSLSVPAEEGRLAVLAHHQAMVCSLTSGTVVVGHRDGREERWQIEPGTLSVGAERSMLLVRNAHPKQEGPAHDA